MAYWLMKSEPESYSWDDLVRDGATEWDGVRNPAARLHLKAMQPGDEAPLVVLVGIAEVADRADIDPARLELLLRLRAGRHQDRGGGCRQRNEQSFHRLCVPCWRFVDWVGRQRSGTKAWPSAAGVFIMVRRLLREMITSTTTVAM